MINCIAIIGLGSIGRRHLRLIRELRPKLKILVYRSGRGGPVEEEKLADKITYNFKDVLNQNIDAAIIASPASFHIEQAISLIKSGKHVLIEKPLSNSIHKVNELIDIQEKANLKAHVGYCLRFDEAAKLFLKYLTKGTGDILYVRIEAGSFLPEWRPNQDYRETVSSHSNLGGGVLLELSHELDYLRWFFGDMKSVYANIRYSNTLEIDVEDSVELIFNSYQGFTISVHLDFNTHSARRNCTVYKTTGEIRWDAISQEVIWQPVGDSQIKNVFNKERDYMFREQLKHFFSSIEFDNETKVSIKDGLMVMRMIEAAQQSHRMRKQINL